RKHGPEAALKPRCHLCYVSISRNPLQVTLPLRTTSNPLAWDTGAHCTGLADHSWDAPQHSHTFPDTPDGAPHRPFWEAQQLSDLARVPGPSRGSVSPARGEDDMRHCLLSTRRYVRSGEQAAVRLRGYRSSVRAGPISHGQSRRVPTCGH
ncbi:unnamed protein product, partial [Gulo gulo]